MEHPSRRKVLQLVGVGAGISSLPHAAQAIEPDSGNETTAHEVDLPDIQIINSTSYKELDLVWGRTSEARKMSKKFEIGPSPEEGLPQKVSEPLDIGQRGLYEFNAQAGSDLSDEYTLQLGPDGFPPSSSLVIRITPTNLKLIPMVV